MSRKAAKALRSEAIQRRVVPTRPTTQPAVSPERADEGFLMNDEGYSRWPTEDASVGMVNFE